MEEGEIYTTTKAEGRATRRDRESESEERVGLKGLVRERRRSERDPDVAFVLPWTTTHCQFFFCGVKEKKNLKDWQKRGDGRQFEL